MKKVLMLIKTTGLEYDDRVRKECLSLKAAGAEPVIGVLADENRRGSGMTGYGVRFHSISLVTRRMIPSARGVGIKMGETCAWFLPWLLKERPDVVWIHDFTVMGMVPVALALRKMGWIQRVVWDQHELPPESWLESRRMRKVLGRWMQNCDAVVSANQERLELIGELLNDGKRFEQGFVLQNFPDEEFRNLPQGTLPEQIVRWLDGKPFFMMQGGGDDDRRLNECVEAVMSLDGAAKLIVIGRYRAEKVAELKRRWKLQFDDRLYFTGKVPQMDIVHYLDHALGSLIFYRCDIRNNILCAPNRLYQAAARGIPVIVGCNPPLKSFVDRNEVGIALQSDGESVAEVARGLWAMLKRHRKFAMNARAIRRDNVWEIQEPTVKKIAGLV